MIISASGVVIRQDVNSIKRAGRATQGVTLMNLGDGDTVVAVATTNGKRLEAPENNEVEEDAQSESIVTAEDIANDTLSEEEEIS
jgi:DNA gyrase subunit A